MMKEPPLPDSRMSRIVFPKTPEPGMFTRWSKEAFQLIRGSPLLFGGFALVLWLIDYAVTKGMADETYGVRDVGLTLVVTPVAVVMLAVGLVLCRVADHGWDSPTVKATLHSFGWVVHVALICAAVFFCAAAFGALMRARIVHGTIVPALPANEAARVLEPGQFTRVAPGIWDAVFLFGGWFLIQNIIFLGLDVRSALVLGMRAVPLFSQAYFMIIFRVLG